MKYVKKFIEESDFINYFQLPSNFKSFDEYTIEDWCKKFYLGNYTIN